MPLMHERTTCLHLEDHTWPLSVLLFPSLLRASELVHVWNIFRHLHKISSQSRIFNPWRWYLSKWANANPQQEKDFSCLSQALRVEPRPSYSCWKIIFEKWSCRYKVKWMYLYCKQILLMQGIKTLISAFKNFSWTNHFACDSTLLHIVVYFVQHECCLFSNLKRKIFSEHKPELVCTCSLWTVHKKQPQERS